MFLKAQERRRIPLSSHLVSTSTSEAENNGYVLSQFLTLVVGRPGQESR